MKEYFKVIDQDLSWKYYTSKLTFEIQERVKNSDSVFPYSSGTEYEYMTEFN